MRPAPFRSRRLAVALLAAAFAALPSQAKKPRQPRGSAKPEVVVQAGADPGGMDQGFASPSLSADGRRMVTKGATGVRLWDVDTGLLVRVFEGTTADSEGILSPDGKKMAVLMRQGVDASKPAELRVWDVETGRVLKKGIKTGANGTIQFLGPDRIFAIQEVWHNHQIWDTSEKGSVLKPLTIDLRTGKQGPPPAGMKTGERIFARDPKGRLWVRAEKYLAAIDPKTSKRVHTLNVGEFDMVAFSADFERYATRPHDGDPPVSVVDTKSGAVLFTLPLPKGAKMGAPVFTADGTRMIANVAHEIRDRQNTVLSPENYIYTWSLETGQAELRKLPFGGMIAPGGRILIATYEMRFLDIATGLPVRKKFGELPDLRKLSFSPDGRRLLVSGEGRLRLWDLAGGRIVNTFKGYEGRFSDDGATIAIQEKGNADWMPIDAQTFQPRGKPAAESRPADSKCQLPAPVVARSADGKLLAAARSDKDVTGWRHYVALTVIDAATCAQRPTIKVPGTVLATTEGRGQVAFSADGQRLAMVTSSIVVTLGALHVWDTKTMEEMRLPAETKVAGSALAFRPRHPEQLAFDASGKVVLLDLAKTEVVATLHDFNGEWLTLLPDNRYAASRGALPYLAFRVGSRAIPFEQFDLRFNRPDAVLEKLGVASPARIEAARAAVRKRLKRSGFTEEQLAGELQLPELQLASQPPPSVKERNLEIEVGAEDASALLDRLLITVNDVPLGGSGGIDLKARKSKRLSEKVTIPLSMGNNLIQVSVLNARGVESLRRSFEIIYDAPAKKPDLYVIAVGVSQYKDTERSLRYAAKDAGDVAAFFGKKASAFNSIKVLKLLDGDATKEKIAAAREFLKPSTVDDEAVVFFAGHGLRDQKLDYYFATADIDFENPAARGIPYEDIEGLLDGIGARRKLLLIDTCNSGELDKDEATLVASNETKTAEGVIKSRGVKVVQTKAPPLGLEGSADLLEDLFADVRRGSGAVAIASAGGAEFALESEAWKNGVFTYALLSTMSGGKARVSEVRDAVTAKVRELTAGKQRPTARSENLNFDFAIY